MLSLRPGGGRGGIKSTLSSSSDLSNAEDAPSFAVKIIHSFHQISLKGDSRFEGREIVRFTREQLLQLKETRQVSDEILKLGQEIASDQQSWGRSENKLAADQLQNGYSETENRDWHSGAPIPSPSKERAREDQREPRDASTGSNQSSGPPPALVKAEVPWSARKGTLSEKDQVLNILNKMTPEKYDLLKGQLSDFGITSADILKMYDLLKGQLTDSGITSADIIKGVIQLISEKAVLEPTFCQMYDLLKGLLVDSGITSADILKVKLLQFYHTRKLEAMLSFKLGGGRGGRDAPFFAAKAARAREAASMMKLDKGPDYSLIEIGETHHVFTSGDQLHPQVKAIYEKLEELKVKMRELKVKYHSEMLAIAFGLIAAEPGTEIRIFKEHWVCLDCHVATKLISKITERAIVVRDASYFHHFKDGVCSCGSNW